MRNTSVFKTPTQQGNTLAKYQPQTSLNKRSHNLISNTPRNRKLDYSSLQNSYSGKKGRKENGLVELTKKFI